MHSRRSFFRATLRSSSLIALAPTVPGFLVGAARAASPDASGRVLVVVQLDGGNDGINTLVPFRDEGYARHRRALRLPAKEIIRVTGEVGLHPALAAAGDLLQDGRLAIVSGVGYPNPNRSHFEGMAIWQTARFDEAEHKGPGWLGRGLDGDRPARDGSPAAFCVGEVELPVALRARRAVSSGLRRAEDFRLETSARAKAEPAAAGPGDALAAFVRRSTLDSYATADRIADVLRGPEPAARYPATELAGRLRLVARMIKAGLGTRVYYALQRGYDTHSDQLPAHARLLGELAGALRGFLYGSQYFPARPLRWLPGSIMIGALIRTRDRYHACPRPSPLGRPPTTRRGHPGQAAVEAIPGRHLGRPRSNGTRHRRGPRL